jgi:glutathione S-transferase
MADITFYTNPMSRGQTVRWMLEEVGEPYDTEILDYATTMKAEPYLSVNPMGKVPAIVHKGKVVTEVAAICCYLADAFPEAGLAPDPKDRADYYRWIFFTSGPVEAAFSNKAAGWEPPQNASACSATAITIWRSQSGKSAYRHDLHRFKPLHGGGPVRRRQRQFHAAVQPARAAAGVHRLCGAHDRPRRLPARSGD